MERESTGMGAGQEGAVTVAQMRSKLSLLKWTGKKTVEIKEYT